MLGIASRAWLEGSWFTRFDTISMSSSPSLCGEIGRGFYRNRDNSRAELDAKHLLLNEDTWIESDYLRS
jgi:hypothetical protein